jgi:hypothetical protein
MSGASPRLDKNIFSTLQTNMLPSRIKPKHMDPAACTLLQRYGPPPHRVSGDPVCGLRALFLIASLALPLFELSTASGQINPGIIDPTNTYSGKTYSQLASGWWQYFMSLPMTNSPLNFIDGNPPVPLSTGQSGPVWFMGGSYASGGALSFTNTIPSIGLFLIISGIEKDNAACPPANWNEPYLRTWAGNVENHAFGMSCIIDGVPVDQIDNVSTSPYRVQSPAFSYTCPAVHNYLHDYRTNPSCYCYENFSGIPYTNNGAIMDGVFLMLSPLSIGSHVINATVQFSFTPAFWADCTYYLTVQPAPLTIAVNQNRQFELTWPQAPDSYTLESTSSIDSPHWQPVTNLSLSLEDGIYRATGPLSTTNQFFRLRPN